MGGTPERSTQSPEYANRLRQMPIQMQMQTTHGGPDPQRPLPFQLTRLPQQVQQKLMRIPDDTRFRLICDIFVRFYALDLSNQGILCQIYPSVPIPDFVMELDSSLLQNVAGSSHENAFWYGLRDLIIAMYRTNKHTQASEKVDTRWCAEGQGGQQLQQKPQNQSQPMEAQQRD